MYNFQSVVLYQLDMELKCTVYDFVPAFFWSKKYFTCACFNCCLQNLEHPDFPKVLRAALDIGKVSLACIFLFVSKDSIQFVLEFFEVSEFFPFQFIMFM